jgi:hypothetical protein
VGGAGGAAITVDGAVGKLAATGGAVVRPADLATLKSAPTLLEVAAASLW